MQLIEHTSWASQSIDEEAGVIKGVKILGFDSKNGRTYKPDAVQGALQLYEGIGINLDHTRGNRRVSDGFGRLRGVELREDGLYGDLEYLKSHPYANQLIESAQRMPEQVGLSHSAEGRISRQGDKEVVEEISEVRSVDVVRYPATTKGLFESENGEAWTVHTLNVHTVKEDATDDELPVDDVADEEETSDPEAGDTDDAEDDTTPVADQPDDVPQPEEEPPAEDVPTVESLQQQLAQLRHRLDISECLLAGNVDTSAMTESQTQELQSRQTREEIEAFVESLPQMTRRMPRRAPETSPQGYEALREEFMNNRRRSRLTRAV